MKPTDLPATRNGAMAPWTLCCEAEIPCVGDGTSVGTSMCSNLPVPGSCSNWLPLTNPNFLQDEELQTVSLACHDHRFGLEPSGFDMF